MPSIDGAISSVLAAKESAVMTQVAFAVVGKRMDAAEQQGQAAVAMVEQAMQLSKAIGAGNNFDALA